jgi:hypothetical protein
MLNYPFNEVNNDLENLRKRNFKMRQTLSQPQSSWSRYAKAAALFTLTTATYLIARTTGWLPGLFNYEESPKDIDNTSKLTNPSAKSNYRYFYYRRRY